MARGSYLDPSAYSTPQGIQDLYKQIQGGQFQFGDPSDKAAIIVKDYNNFFGRNPTPEEIAIAAPQYQEGGPGTSYVASLHQQQQQLEQAPQKEAQAIQQQIPIIQNLINQQMQGQIKNLTDPNSPAYQAYSGNLQNLGITPSSGAFQAGLGGQIGQAASEFTGQALGQIGLPIAGGYSQGQMQPFQQSIQQPYQLQQRGYDAQDFMMQADLARKMQESAQPGWAEKFGVPLGAATIQGLGSAARKPGQSAVCNELFRLGLCTKEELDSLHAKVIPSFFKKCRALHIYKNNGRKLVDAANNKRVDWSKWKMWFINRPLDADNAIEAINRYAGACDILATSIGRPDLFDRRVYRDSFIDSLLYFLPVIFDKDYRAVFINWVRSCFNISQMEKWIWQ